MCVFLLYNLECTVSFTLLERGRKARGGEDVVVGWSPKICPSAAPRRPQAGRLERPLGADPGDWRLYHQVAVQSCQSNGWGSFCVSLVDLALVDC